MRKGYLGQIFKIANKLSESKDPFVTKYLQSNVSFYKSLINKYF